MPIIYQMNSNNSAISARFDFGKHYGDNGDFGVQRIEERMKNYAGLIDPGFTTWAADPASGIEAMRAAVDQVLETGRPTYVISRFPFRPGGHASDQSPAPEEMLLDQFKKFRDILVSQLSGAAPAGTTGAQLADMVEEHAAAIDAKVDFAITGCKVLSRKEIRELSQPGITTVGSRR